MNYYKLLTIGGSDCSGGAGIQADLKTFAALGCYGMSVITALTAQNTEGVRSIHAASPAFIEDQLSAVLEDLGADAVKIGMLYSVGTIETVARLLKESYVNKIVLDPVMVAQSGGKLIQDDAVSAIRSLLMPLSSVVTPNIPEASIFVNGEIHTSVDMQNAVRKLGSSGARSILLKGGHLGGKDSSDLLYFCQEDRCMEFNAERITTRNNHGTGCTLSSAIASYLAKGFSIEESVRHAKEYVTGAIQAGVKYKTGRGHGPLHHFFKQWE